MRLWELKLHRGISFRRGGRELGCPKRDGSGFIPLLHQLCEMRIKGNQSSFHSFLLLGLDQFIEDTKVPIWVGLSTRVPKGCTKRVC